MERQLGFALKMVDKKTAAMNDADAGAWQGRADGYKAVIGTLKEVVNGKAQAQA